NLHPTEAYVILPPIESPDGGLYHYNPYLHALERRIALPEAFAKRVESHFQSPGFLLGMADIAWREAWKYGERALRYCHHDLGHALAAVSFAANLLGWKATALTSLSDDDISAVLGTSRTDWPEEESEHAQILLFISPAHRRAIPRGLPNDWVRALAGAAIEGRPNRLSPNHVAWPVIEETEQAARKDATPEMSVRFPDRPLVREPASRMSAAELIRRRRSAVAFDGQTTITRDQFVAILDKTLPRHGLAPFDLELGEPAVHLVLFVHRVIGLESGLYLLARRPEDLADLKRSLDRRFLWAEAPGPLPLYLLRAGDFQREAIQLSCRQTIAGHGDFSLGMLARFQSVLERDPWRYKRLFWEAGMIGQILYLEAEAHGVRGTGIGCFFDDEVHQMIGLRTNAYQSLYHFTIGGPVDDPRLTTEPPYGHLPKDRR
ncbi:MAG TPA: SagB/ThcOx family dehydrogenase, partial [Elusimicrobiota bacterium]|nr:SagB/ThcOx family dehydrogenase [Elusimicrobiota bacterium]